MPRPIETLDALSLLGREGGVNEDAWGASGRAVLVIDGATGLGDRPLTAAPSDAAWLAEEGVDAVMARCDGADVAAGELLAAAIGEVRERFAAERIAEPNERFERPTAAFVLLRAFEAEIEISGLGDCIALVRFPDGRVEHFGPDPGLAEGEAEAASAFLAAAGGAGGGFPSFRSGEALAMLRANRNRHNTQGGYWCFGLDVEAAAHVRVLRLPRVEGSLALLASDGFEALWSDYGAFPREDAIDAALDHGLHGLADELRRIEREVDPDGHRFPRFKRSDDATAVLVRL